MPQLYKNRAIKHASYSGWYNMMSLLILSLSLWVHYACSQDLTRTILPDNFLTEGAVCLDGSPPGYYMRRGTGDGANKWVLYIPGGGWCFSIEECSQRSSIMLGSSAPAHWPESLAFEGILENDATINPDFYNWNHVYFIYCDGGSFAGDREKPDMFEGRPLYYRGYRNLKAIMRHLNEERGLQSATDVILTGCSAGGMGVLLHADFLRTQIVNTANYKALSDAGYFFDIPGSSVFANGLASLMALQNIEEAIIPACRRDHNGTELWRCISPPVVYSYVRTPLFTLNSQFDSAVLDFILKGSCTPPNCDAEGAALFQSYYGAFDSLVQPVLSSRATNGYFLDSCYTHCQTTVDERAWSQYAIDGRTIAQTFGDWYFERPGDTRLKDCGCFPCNPTCSDVPSDTVSNPTCSDAPSGAVRILTNPLTSLTLIMTSFILLLHCC